MRGAWRGWLLGQRGREQEVGFWEGRGGSSGKGGGICRAKATRYTGLRSPPVTTFTNTMSQPTDGLHAFFIIPYPTRRPCQAISLQGCWWMLSAGLHPAPRPSRACTQRQ